MKSKIVNYLALIISGGVAIVVADSLVLLFFGHSISRIIHEFTLPSVVFVIVFIAVLGIYTKCFKADFFRNCSETEYKKRFKKIGSIPIKLIGIGVVIHLVFLVIVFFSGYFLDIDSKIKMPLFLSVLSFGLLAGAFMYVISDTLVFKTLIDHDLTYYPHDLRDNRQELKFFIFPIVVSIMSLLFASAVTVLGISNAGGTLDQINSRGWHIVQLSVVFYFFTVFILAVIVKRNLGKFFSSMLEQMENLSSERKDLTQRIRIFSVDELASLSGMVNVFCEQLSWGIKDIKNGQNELSGAQGVLEENVLTIEDSLKIITQAAEQVLNKTKDQIESVNTSSVAVKDIASLIEKMEKSVSTQTTSMSQGSAAVEEMVSNISSIGTVTERMTAQFMTVGKASEEGKLIQNESKERIRKIVDQSQSLQETNKIIAAIAAQTNLLAMNAAIEAAHAGQMGRGFSVVADEIRKLAENSSKESRKIGVELKEIVSTINSIVKDAETSERVFSEVSMRINETEKLVFEVDNAINEQKAGADQVLESLKAMNDINSQVVNYSRQMSNGNGIMLREINALHDSAAEVSSRIEKVSQGIKKINEGAQDVTKQAVRSRDSIDIISSIADEFKV
jgi:methyl-accepting chemotaxis protein